MANTTDLDMTKLYRVVKLNVIGASRDTFLRGSNLLNLDGLPNYYVKDDGYFEGKMYHLEPSDVVEHSFKVGDTVTPLDPTNTGLGLVVDATYLRDVVGVRWWGSLSDGQLDETVSVVNIRTIRKVNPVGVGDKVIFPTLGEEAVVLAQPDLSEPVNVNGTPYTFLRGLIALRRESLRSWDHYNVATVEYFPKPVEAGMSPFRVQAKIDEAIEEFKKKVATVAMDYAERNDWCDKVKEALGELEIEVPSPHKEFTVTVTYRVTSTVTSDRRDIDLDWVRQSICENNGELSMDNDWGDTEWVMQDMNVTDLEDVDE